MEYLPKQSTEGVYSTLKRYIPNPNVDLIQMQNFHNFLIGLASGVPSWTYLFITSGDIPTWLYLITAIVVPLFIGLGGKGADIAYREWVRRRESEEFRKKLEITKED